MQSCWICILQTKLGGVTNQLSLAAAQEGARSALPVMTPCLAVEALTQQQYATAVR